MTLHVKKGTDWQSVYNQARALAPEAFDADRISNFLMHIEMGFAGRCFMGHAGA